MQNEVVQTFIRFAFSEPEIGKNGFSVDAMGCFRNDMLVPAPSGDHFTISIALGNFGRTATPIYRRAKYLAIGHDAYKEAKLAKIGVQPSLWLSRVLQSNALAL